MLSVLLGVRGLKAAVELRHERVGPLARGERFGVLSRFDPVVRRHVGEMFGFRRKDRGIEALRARQSRAALGREIVEVNAEMIGHHAGGVVAQNGHNQRKRSARIFARERAVLPG